VTKVFDRRGEFSKGVSLPICRCNRRVKVEMFINLKTARALGITILPQSGRADEIFE
jgi:hypothetical protein